MSSWVCIAVCCVALVAHAQATGGDEAIVIKENEQESEQYTEEDASYSSYSGSWEDSSSSTSETASNSDSDEQRCLTCGKNEVEACVKSCPPERTCRNRFIQYSCINDPKPCTKKCICAKGYYRNSIGECITEAQCDQCSKPNEFYSCNSACDTECDKINTQNRTNCPIKNIKCNEKCYCDDGYARDANGNCIPIDQCKPQTLNCGPNEEERCATRCPEKTCKDRGLTVRCDTRDGEPCRKQCLCCKGYVRNAIGQCIAEAECDKCTKKNEFYSCDSACDNECKTIGQQNRTNCPIVNIKCNEMCYCEDGYSRDGDGNCIPNDQCLKCGRNEVQRCVSSCPPERTCRNRDAQYKCQAGLPCTTKCVCADGYYRNSLGECITREQCEQCDKPNEFYSCGGACDNECKTLGQQNRTNCPIMNIKCNEMCYCEDGYARDAKGNCIPVDQCKPQTLNCGPHEEEQCVKRCPPEKTCQNRGLAVPCAYDNKPCTKKCVCSKGYIRNANGQCVNECECDKCKKPNEFYSCDSACDNECKTIGQQNRTNCPIVNIKCNEMCYCKDGYSRDGDGNCIPNDQCLKCGRNEVQRCVASCPPERTCRNRDAQYKCQAGLPCTTKCVCADGYYRNSLGECITREQCEQCDKPNEFYSCGGACDNECKTLGQQNRTNCPIMNIKCNEMCYCEDGYARDAKGNCIPVDQCKPQTLNCGPHEEEQCVKRCPPEKTCQNRGLAVRCAYDDKPCTKKCVCSKGYIRNANGQCVNECECDKCKKPNEFYSCDSACDNECKTIGQQNRTNCPIVNIKCNEMCYCKDGYSRDGDGNCIPNDQCLKCGRNEVQRCVASCPPERTCRNRDAQYKCQAGLPCTTKCVCADGYYRNSLGECITREQCEQCDKPNEFYSCGGACDNECKTLGQQNRTNCPIINIKCNEKCYCEDGYARDAKGNCIPVDQCKPQTLNCGPHEEEQCVKRCPPEKTCQNRGLAVRCAYDDKPCTKKCVCCKGYIRNANGQCVNECECDKCKKPNEFYSCDSACDNECKTIGQQNRTNCPIVNIKCNEMCYCKDGYSRDGDGNCIPNDQCLKCGRNEVQRCVSSCPPERTCRNRDAQYKCQAGLPCTTKCVCADGYYRNSLGECITREQCEQCDKPNEFYSCGGACDNECKTLGQQNRTNCPIINIKCNEMCYCEDGYARDAKGNCIPVDQCKPQTLNCGPNEEEQCIKRCPPEKTCKNRGLTVRCKRDDSPCTKKCVCSKGYFRNAIGQCITAAQCDKCKKPNEFYACDSACDNECVNIDKQNRTNCPIQTYVCQKKCYCENGYARDGNGDCIPVDKCKRCGPNEILKSVKSCPPERTCRNRNIKYKCKSCLPSTTKCVCADGYYRNAIGECITGKQCDKCNKSNEFYSCGSACDNECDKISYQNRTNCPIINIKCNEKCYCDDGYARDAKGNCIPIDKCPKCSCKKNEEYVLKKPSCPPETCASIVAKYDCSKAPAPKPGCACKSGFKRLKENSPCIPICECPQIANTKECQQKTCGPNEEYILKKKSCPPETCASIVSKYDCSKAPPPKPGCACKSGFKRLKENSPCIPICECPQIANSTECQQKTCGPNEEYILKKKCCPPETCASIVSKYDCSKAPPPKPGCACKSGFKRLKENSPCIPICKCPQIANTKECQQKTCGPNEEYVQKKRTCPPETCVSIVADYDCRNAPPPKPGCACISGFLRRNDTSPCIPACQCSELASSPDCQAENCKDPNEEFVQEKQSCPPDSCNALVARYDCSKAPGPQPGCTCKSGYRRLNGKCVPICECPEMANSPECQKQTCDDPNEEFVKEKQTCPPDFCVSLVARYDCSHEPPRKPGCQCKSGFLRLNATSPCRPICECPQMASSPDCQAENCKDPNEEFVQEKRSCPPDSCNALVARYDCSEAPGPQPGCTCKSGYRRLNGKCVPICECPEMANSPECQKQTCDDPNEEFVKEKQTCPPDFCISLVARYDCSHEPPRKPGCQCKSGFLRVNATSPCRPICECPEMASSPDCQKPTCGTNEEYVEEKQTCPPETCASITARYDCSKEPPRKPGCACKSGYLRLNETSPCIPQCHCPQLKNMPECKKQTCGPNEEYVEEKYTCPGDSCVALVIKINCSNAPPPEPGCVCKSGYRRLKDGTCVPTCDCPEMASAVQCQKPKPCEELQN